MQHLQLGREIGGGIGDAAHRRLVGGDEHGARALGGGGAGEIGEQPRQEAGGHAGEGERRGGLQDAGEIGHRLITRSREGGVGEVEAAACTSPG